MEGQIRLHKWSVCFKYVILKAKPLFYTVQYCDFNTQKRTNQTKRFNIYYPKAVIGPFNNNMQYYWPNL